MSESAQWVFGVHPVLEALKVRPAEVEELLYARDPERGPMKEILRRAGRSEAVVCAVSRAELTRRVGDGAHQGVALKLSGRGASEPVEDPLDLVEAARAAGREPLLLVLDGIQDPHNLGALFRSAWALGADGVVLPKDRAAGLTPAAIKASAGAALQCPWTAVTNIVRTLESLADAGVWSVAADVSDDAPAPDTVDLTGPLAVVVGAEGKGLRRLVLERCDHRVRIPMARTLGSLNASVAGAVLLYEVVRQRRAAAEGTPSA